MAYPQLPTGEFDDIDLDRELDLLLANCETRASPDPSFVPEPSCDVLPASPPFISPTKACKGRFECVIGTKFGYVDIPSFLSRVFLWDITRDQHADLAHPEIYNRDWLVETQSVKQSAVGGPVWCIKDSSVLDAVTHLEAAMGLEPNLDRLLRALTFREDMAMKRLPFSEILVPTARDRAYRNAKDNDITEEKATEILRARAEKDRRYRERRKLKIAIYNDVLAPQPVPPTDKALYQREYYRAHRAEIGKRRRDMYKNNEDYRRKDLERRSRARVSV